MVVIHPRLQADELRFVLLGSSGEDRKKPFEKEWQEKANYRYDDHKLLDHIKQGGNYGVAGGYGDLHILDSDDLSRWQDMGVLSLIPSSFTIESRPGHRQFYLRSKEHFQSGGLFDPENTELNDQGKPEFVHIGDIKAGSKEGICGGQAVGPSCRHPSGSIYTVINDLPIAEVSREVLSSIISRFKTSKKVNTNSKRFEEDVTKSKQRKYEDKDPLDSLQVVDIMPPEGNVSRSGNELRGDHPIHGSTNGGNYVINVSKNVWHCKRCESGGGPVAAIAVKHGLISCSDAQAGELRGDLFKEVLKIAKEQYLPHECSEPTIRKVSLEDQFGTVGLAEDGTVKQVVVNKDEVKSLSWISDCALYIDTETSANNVTEFTFKGEGAKDRRKVCFTLPADSLEHQKFKTALINAFGAVNRVGKLDFETVQKLTRNTRFIRRVEVPSWNDNIPMLPGVGLASDTEFRLSPMTPARVFDGNLQVAKELLRTLLKTHPFTSILVTAIMGAPAVARWRPDDRIAVALWAGTGTQKTTVAKACMSIYGSEYQSDRYLLKHGRGGSTVVAALEIMARAGILPQILDDVKAVDPKDHQNYVTIIHAVIEGSDKQRGKKDGGLREAQIFRSTPIITGEVRPEEASTDARVCNLSWSKPDLDRLNEIECRVGEMPIIGYHWLRFLAETDQNLNDGFNTARSKKELEFSRAGFTTNPGRLATIYTVLMATWNLLCASPLGVVFKEATEDFTYSLTRAIQEQGSIVNSDTEVSKFLVGVNELLASQPGLFQSSDGKTLLGKVVGKHTDEGLFLLPNEILAELDKLKVFTQKPTVDSIGKALADAGKLVIDTDKKHRQVVRRVNGQRLRGWLLSPTAFDGDTTPMVTEKRQQYTPVTTNTTVTTEKERVKFKENFNDQKDGSDSRKGSKEFGGDSGDNGDSNVIDSGFSDTTQSPSKKEVGTPQSLDGIKADLLRAVERAKAKEGHFRTPSKVRWTEDQDKPKKKIVPIRFLVDFAGHKKDDVVGIEVSGDLSVRPGLCELISCGQCPTVLNGSQANSPVCNPCSWLGKRRAEA